MPEDNELLKIQQILSKNKNKNFVRRILDPNIYPKLWDNPSGEPSTHSMGWGEADGRYFVYPTVVSTEHGTLQRIGNPKDAQNHAFRTGEFIEVSSPEEADWFSKKYKRVWEQN